MSRDTVAGAMMPRTAQSMTETDLRRAAQNLPPVGFVSANQAQKDAERAEMERQLAAFQKRGGKVEQLGNTAIKRGKSRRQAETDSARNRLAE